MRLALILFAALAALAVASWVYLFETFEAPPVDPNWAIAPSPRVEAGDVTVRYTGCATLVFSDGDTQIVIDGWFSRPGVFSLVGGTVEPDLDAIERGLAANALTEAAVVFAVHSHYDHAMDAPEVARRTGALLMGSASTAMIGRGWGLPEAQIRLAEDREPVRFGAFTVTPIASRHFQFADPAVRERALADPTITEPLVPPVGLFEYKVGQPYALLIEHPQGRVLIQGSAGFIEGSLADVEADVVLLGIGGLGSQSPDYRETYWRETVEASGATRVIPIHWDGLTSPIEGPFRGARRIVALVVGTGEGSLAFMKQKEAERPDLSIETLPRFDPVVLFAAQ